MSEQPNKPAAGAASQSFWQRTVGIFGSARVEVTLRGGRRMVGHWGNLDYNGGWFWLDEAAPSPVQVDFSQVLAIEEARE